ncbi:MAG: YfhO family protein [Deltaproteobacteria bacterium]|nr:YfhO family protein [Deltaproteobacteria bacterium]
MFDKHRVHLYVVSLLFIILAVGYSRLLTRVDFNCLDDVTEYSIPLSQMVVTHLDQGQNPIWNPYSDMGAPLWANNPFMGPFYPLFPLFYFFKPGPAVNAGFFIHILWLALGMYVLLVRKGISPSSAFAGSVIIGMSAHVQMMVNQGYLPDLISFSYLPWSLVLLDAGGTDILKSALAGIPLGLALLGGHTVNNIVVFLTCSLVFLISASLQGKGFVRNLSRATAQVIAAFIFALALSAIYVLPMALEYLNNPAFSGRQLRLGFLHIYEPWRILSYLVPLYEPGKRGTEFIGLIPIAIIVTAVSRKRNIPTVTGIISMLLGYLLITSPSTGVWEFVIAKIPVLNTISYTFPFGITVTFGASMAAAAGLDELDSYFSQRSGDLLRHVFLPILISTAAFLFAINFVRGFFDMPDTAWAIGFSVAMILISAYRIKGGGQRSSFLKARRLLAGLVALELMVYSFVASEPADRHFSLENFFAGGKIAKAIDRDGKRGRVLLQQTSTPFCEWAIRPNESLVRRFEAANLESKLIPECESMLSHMLDGMSLTADDVAASAKAPDDRYRLKSREIKIGGPGGDRNKRILDLAGVRYIVLDKQRKITGGVFEPAVQDGTARLWINRHVVLKARLFGRAKLIGRRWLYYALSDPALDTSNEVLLLDDDPDSTAAAFTLKGNKESPKGRIEPLNRKPTVMEYSIETSRPSLAVISETWHPGWKAYLDGIQVPVIKANGCFMAVPVPAGHFVLKIAFEPASFYLGALISMAVLAFLILLVFKKRISRVLPLHPRGRSRQG